jgi:hypothetical protein
MPTAEERRKELTRLRAIAGEYQVHVRVLAVLVEQLLDQLTALQAVKTLREELARYAAKQRTQIAVDTVLAFLDDTTPAGQSIEIHQDQVDDPPDLTAWKNHDRNTVEITVSRESAESVH